MSFLPVVWLTGLSGAGKTTIANQLAEHAKSLGLKVEILDGDCVRAIIENQSFTKTERNRNVKMVALIAHYLQKHGSLVIVAMISPYRESRDFARKLCPSFLEVYIATSLEECERRDVKGLYRRARAGEIEAFTGISDPYEAPIHPELHFDTTKVSRDEITTEIWKRIGGR